MTPRMEKAVVGVLSALPALILAGVGWLQAHTEQQEKLDLADNYASYVRDQMREGEAVERSLHRCMELLREVE